MSKITGATLLVRSLKQQGVEYMFGVVGFPVQPVAAAAQLEGMTYVGMRNEQSASYAAQAAGYLTGRPGACLTVCGPGVIHALAGLANAKWNAWPMIHIGGASPTYQNGMGAFQEERQVMAATPYCKYAHQVDRADRIPYFVEQAVRTSIFGRPGAAYLDLPDNIIREELDESSVSLAATVPEPPRFQAAPESIEAALDALESAERPLVIIGKGMAWSTGGGRGARLHRTDSPSVPRLPDGQGSDGRQPRPVGRSGPQPRPARGRRRVPHGGAAQLDHALRASAAVLQGRAGDPARSPPGGDRRQRAGRGRVAGRRPGGRVPAQRGAARSPVVLSRRHRVAVGPCGECGQEPGVHRADARGRLRADELLSGAPRHPRVDAGRCDHRERGCQHHGHRPHPVAELAAPHPARCRHLRHDGGGPSASPSPPRWLARTSRWSQSKATRGSGSRGWRSRPSAAWASRSRRWC